MIYEPIQIDSLVGVINEEYGVGVITPIGAFLTGIIPSLKRIKIKPYFPKTTIFKRKDGTIERFWIPPWVVANELMINIYFKRLGKAEAIPMNFTPDLVNIPAEIIIQEKDLGKFEVCIQSNGTFYQPSNGWTFKSFE